MRRKAERISGGAGNRTIVRRTEQFTENAVKEAESGTFLSGSQCRVFPQESVVGLEVGDRFRDRRLSSVPPPGSFTVELVTAFLEVDVEHAPTIPCPPPEHDGGDESEWPLWVSADHRDPLDETA